MVDYARIRTTAEDLIVKNGREVTISKQSRVAADPAQPWRGPTDLTAAVSFTGYAVFFDYVREDIDGDRIRRGDKRALVAAKSVEGSLPTEDLGDFDILLDGSTTWRVVWIDTLEPGPSRVIYDIQLRK